MASLPVNNNLNVLATIVNQTSGMPDNQSALNARQEEVLKDSFDMVMSRVNSQTVSRQDSTAATTAKISDTAKNTVSTVVMQAGVAAGGNSAQNASKAAAAKPGENTETGNDAVKQTDRSDVKNDNSDKTVSDENISDENISGEQKEAVEKAGEKLVEEVAEEMEVTPEEVEEAMEILGLSALQLLDPDNMKQLLVTLSGNEDHLSIITDGELYGHLQNLLNEVSLTLEDLQTQLGLSEEELNSLIADMAVVETETETVVEIETAVGVEVEVIPEEIQTQTDVAVNQTAKPEEVNLEEVNLKEVNLEEVNLEGMKDYAVTVHKDGETVKVKVTVDDASGDKSVKEEVTAQPKLQAETENKPDSRDSSGTNKGEGNAQSSFVMQTPVEQPMMNEIVQEQPFMERYVSTEDILNQIGEYIKLNLKADVQELELQLHPASLGNVNIQLTAKDGMITAQFTTQNEAVKAAIESQLVQLRTQFEEQGLKVDAVEVAVADYRFNRSFSGNEENAGEGSGSNKKNRRKINLSELDMEELPEDMEDSDRITAQMMAQNGNTVDYTA